MEVGWLSKPVDGNGGELEADETLIGGRSKFMSAKHRAKTIKESSTAGKETILGVLRRGSAVEPSKVVAKHVSNRQNATVQAEVRKHVPSGSAVYTDALMSDDGLAADYVREVVDHVVEYVRDNVHTNGMENNWSLFKRALKGTYVRLNRCISIRTPLSRLSASMSARITTEAVSVRCWAPLPANV